MAPQAANPVRHSSCATAGMPNRLLAAIRACSPASACIPAAAGTGRLPYTRVSWPSPFLMSSSSGGCSSLNWSCIGATPSPSPDAPCQMLPSWATFSASVIRLSRSATRSSADRAGSRQGSAWSIGIDAAPRSRRIAA